jgi:protease I
MPHLAQILILLPACDVDPTEVAFPWQVWRDAGHSVVFATPDGTPAVADPITLTGAGLPLLARGLRARPAARAAHAEMVASGEWQAPRCWSDLKASDFAALHFPGGHGPGMRAYCGAAHVARLARDAFAANQPVSAVCHGVLPLARAGVLVGRTTTSLTALMERSSILLTRRALPGHYRTYPEMVEVETRRALGAQGRYITGPLLPGYAEAKAPEAGFVVRDGHYLSGRWPGDAWTLALRLGELL